MSIYFRGKAARNFVEGALSGPNDWAMVFVDWPPIVLTAKAEDFARWVVAKTNAHLGHKQLHPGEHTLISFYSAIHKHYEANPAGVIDVELQGSCCVVGQIGAPPILPMISFRVIPLGSDVIEVLPQCTQRAAILVFHEFITAIKNRPWFFSEDDEDVGSDVRLGSNTALLRASELSIAVDTGPDVKATYSKTEDNTLLPLPADEPQYPAPSNFKHPGDWLLAVRESPAWKGRTEYQLCSDPKVQELWLGIKDKERRDKGLASYTYDNVAHSMKRDLGRAKERRKAPAKGNVYYLEKRTQKGA